MNEPVVRPIISDSVLLGTAIAIALIFISLLAFDLVRRRRRQRRHSHGSHQPPPTATWRKPFETLRDIRQAFAQMARRRARRERYHERIRQAEERRRDSTRDES